MPETPSQPLQYGRAAHFKLPVRLIVLILIICAGAGLLWWNIPEIYKCIAARNWPTTPGEVVMKSGGRAVGFNIIPSGYAPFFYREHVSVGCKFTVNGIACYSSTVSCDVDRAVEVSLQHPLRSSVDVYYNPQNPSNAVIDRTVGSDTLGATLVGLVLILFGSGSLILRNKRSRQLSVKQ